MKHLLLFEYFSFNDLLRSNIIDKANKVCKTIPSQEINFQTFCNYIIPGFISFKPLFYEKISRNRYIKGNIESQLKIGDVIAFGNIEPKYYCIYIGNSRVLESDGWNKMPKEKNIIEIFEDYTDILKIYRDENIINNFRH